MSARYHIIVGLLCLTAMFAVGAMMLRQYTDVIKQMPPTSTQMLRQGLHNLKTNKQAAKHAAAELNKRIQIVKQVLRHKYQPKKEENPE